MSVALHEPITLEKFLAWEECQPARFEFDGFHPIAMTGGTVAHNRIMRRLHRLLEQHLEGTPCEPFGPDVKIIADGRARYPDAVVSCTPQPDRSQVIENPVVVFEVLSESTVAHGPHRKGAGVPGDTVHLALRDPGTGPYRCNRICPEWRAVVGIYDQRQGSSAHARDRCGISLAGAIPRAAHMRTEHDTAQNR